jgi:predicted  nucleic acid-binding Zn-ribbon protein
MASAIARQPCGKCDKGVGKLICGGCQQWYCNKHYNEHQEELVKEMDDIAKKHDELHSHLTMDNMNIEHPFLVRTNEWEERSIHRIRTAANEARTKLKQSLDQIKEETKALLSLVADELKSGRESEEYTEVELKRWMDELETLKQHLLNPPEIELHSDTQDDTDASMIRLIKLKFFQGRIK